MPAAVLAPYLIQAGGAIGGSLLARNSAKGASNLSPAEQAAQGAQTTAAQGLNTQGANLAGMAGPQLATSGNYFSSLVSGNRASMQQTLAPDVQSINENYGGAARTLSRFLRGGVKDTQQAELERERAGQIGSLFRDARPKAAGMLAQIGQGNATGAANAFGGAGSIFGQQAQQGQQNRMWGEQVQHQAGSDFGGLMFNLLQQYATKGGANTSSLNRLATRPSGVPNIGFLPSGGSSGYFG